MDRPAVSIVLPFHGTPEEARRAVDALLAIDRGPGDEIVVVDNSGSGAVAARDGVRVIVASDEHSAYYARNVGSQEARNAWLLFVDGDCRPRADILDRYFDAAIADDVGAVVGEVVGVPEQQELTARYARSRGHLGQRVHFEWPFRPWGVTANLLVRRDAWASVGGFLEGIRSTGDAEFSWRLQDAGWRLDFRPAAEVEHYHRERISRLIRQGARYGAGRAWVIRRYPGSIPPPKLLRPVGRSLLGIVVWTATGRFERAIFKGLDGIFVTSEWFAFRLSNTPPVFRRNAGAAPVGLVAERFPAAGDPAVSGALELQPACIEAAWRPIRVDRDASRGLPIAWGEDDGDLRRLRAALGLALRHPVRVASYVLARRRDGAPPLLAIAAPARRLAEAGVRRLRAADAEAAMRTAAIARLAGVPVD